MKLLYIIFIASILLPFANADIVINEIMYDPAGQPERDHEWIEIYNSGDEEVDLEGWRFFENNNNHRLALEQGDDMLIESNESIVIVQDTEAFLEDYEDYEGTILDSSFSLNNGEYIALRDSDGEIADEVEYSNEWGDDEEGFSLELRHPDLNNEMGENWGSSENESGTPGEQNSIFDEGVDAFMEQEINLRLGWNLMSSYLVPNDLNLEVIFEDLIQEGSLILVKDGNGRFFSPIGDFNNIEAWNPQEAYYVKVNERTSLTIEGEEMINPEIELTMGWNHIAYPSDQRYDMEGVIENVLQQPLIEEEQLEILKDGKGRFFIPRWNFYNIPRMYPGEGYMMKVTENTTIDFSQIG